jgi:hypothetical protein
VEVSDGVAVIAVEEADGVVFVCREVGDGENQI